MTSGDFVVVAPPPPPPAPPLPPSVITERFTATKQRSASPHGRKGGETERQIGTVTDGRTDRPTHRPADGASGPAEVDRQTRSTCTGWPMVAVPQSVSRRSRPHGADTTRGRPQSLRVQNRTLK